VAARTLDVEKIKGHGWPVGSTRHGTWFIQVVAMAFMTVLTAMLAQAAASPTLLVLPLDMIDTWAEGLHTPRSTSSG
jgi:hypothetical protein